MQTASDILAKIESSIAENSINEKLVEVLKIIKDSVKNVISHMGEDTPEILIESNIIATLHIITSCHDFETMRDANLIVDNILS